MNKGLFQKILQRVWWPLKRRYKIFIKGGYVYGRARWWRILFQSILYLLLLLYAISFCYQSFNCWRMPSVAIASGGLVVVWMPEYTTDDDTDEIAKGNTRPMVAREKLCPRLGHITSFHSLRLSGIMYDSACLMVAQSAVFSVWTLSFFLFKHFCLCEQVLRWWFSFLLMICSN